MGPLRFSAKAGFSDRPSLACLKTLRHPASPASTRGYSTLSCDARRSQTGRGKSKAQQKRKTTSKAETSLLGALYPFSSSPRGRGSSSAELNASMQPDFRDLFL